MSLVAHWKLDGNTKDSIGGNNGSGSPTYVDGKIGQGIDSTGERITVENTGGIKSALNGNHFTLSMWWRQYDNSTYRWSDSIEVDGKRLERGRGDDGNTAADFWCNIGSGDGNQLFNSAISGVDGTEWFHIVVRRNGDDYEVWVNGEITNSGTRTADMSNSGNLEIDYQTNGTEMDDIRLYDHAISEKKIQQLSQAKVLHYKFDSNLKEIESNFDSGSTANWNVTNGYIKSDTSVSGNYSFGTDGQGAINATLSPTELSGGKRIESFDFWWWEKGSQSGHRVTLEDSSGNDVMYSETENPQWQLSNGSGGDDAIRGYTGQGYQIWTHFEFEFNWQNGTYDYRLSTIDDEYVSTGTQSLSNTTGVETIRLHSPTGSGNYNRFDSFNITYRSGVTDSSGYGNTGTLNGPTFTDSSKVGSGAYEFGGAGDLIGSSLYYDTTNVGELTVSAWYNSSSTSQHIIASSDRNEYWRLGVGSDGEDGVQWTVNSSDMVSTASKSSLQDGNWHHILAVFDTSLTNDHKIYIDGELDSQESHFNSGIGSGAVSYTHIGVGSEASSQSGSIGPDDWMDGKLDDVRVYHSALSASEVQEVYEQRASIDSGGNFHSHELLDTPSSEQIADENEWELGTSGSQGSFSQNGSTSENDIVEYADPFGKLVPTWRCSPDSNSGADGGWNMNFQGDNSDRLRFSVFVKRTGDSMNGNYYHGCDNGGNTLNLDGSTNGNPYFHSGSLPETNQWYLLVGILHPNSYSGGQGDVTGVYDMNGEKLSGGTDYKWGTGSRQEMRDYLYYSTDTSERQYFVYPRVDVVDGSEPDIASLVNGLDSRTNNQRDMNVTTEGTLEAGLNEVGPASGSLVGWWPLDGDTRDYAGSANGTNNGATITSGLGQSAYDFDGTANVNLNNGPSVNSVTVSAWLYPTELGSDNYQWFVPNGDYVRSYIRNDTDKIRWRVEGDSIEYIDTNISLSTNTWYHTVHTYNQGNGDMKVYINKSLEATGNQSSSGEFNLDEIYLGADGFQSYDEYHGKIQDVRIYNRALTTEEVKTLYNLTDPRQNQQVVQTDNGLVHTKHEYDERL